jgi:hypothetical protein
VQKLGADQDKHSFSLGFLADGSTIKKKERKMHHIKIEGDFSSD